MKAMAGAVAPLPRREAWLGDAPAQPCSVNLPLVACTAPSAARGTAFVDQEPAIMYLGDLELRAIFGSSTIASSKIKLAGKFNLESELVR